MNLPEHLPENNAIAPDITGVSKGSKVDTLWRIPFHWPPTTRGPPVNICID